MAVAGHSGQIDYDDDADYDIKQINDPYDDIPKTKELHPDEIDCIPNNDTSKKMPTDLRRELSFHENSDFFVVRQKNSDEED